MATPTHCPPHVWSIMNFQNTFTPNRLCCSSHPPVTGSSDLSPFSRRRFRNSVSELLIQGHLHRPPYLSAVAHKRRGRKSQKILIQQYAKFFLIFSHCLLIRPVQADSGQIVQQMTSRKSFYNYPNASNRATTQWAQNCVQREENCIRHL